MAHTYTPPYFELSETLTEKHGIKTTSFNRFKFEEFVLLLPRRSRWPSVEELDFDLNFMKLPYLRWSDYDWLPERQYNCHVNGAPRICCVVKSAFEDKGIPLQFILIDWDVELPWYFQNSTFMLGFFLGGLAVFAGRSIYTNSLIFGGIAFFLFLAALGAITVAVKFFTNLRSFFLVDYFVERAIFNGKIKPNITNAPWQDLESFEIIQTEQKFDLLPYETPHLTQRFIHKKQIRAHFGVRFPAMTISNGTWPEEVAKELHRIFQLNFIENRPHYLNLHHQESEERTIRVQITIKADADNKKAFELLAAHDDRALDQPLRRARELLFAACQLLIADVFKWTPAGGYELLKANEIKGKPPENKQQRIASAQKPIAEAAAILDDPATPPNDALRGILALVQQTWRDRDLTANFSEERYAAYRADRPSTR